MDSLKKAVSTIKNKLAKKPLERTIYEVCSDENWGSANTVLHEISEKTFNHEDRQVIMKCIWEILKSPNKEWRRLYKVLNLIDHLIKFGSTACLHEIQDEAFKIRMFQDFSYREGSEEKGSGVRDKAKYLTSMLNDRKVMDEEREKAKKTWSKFSGISSDSTYSRRGYGDRGYNNRRDDYKRDDYKRDDYSRDDFKRDDYRKDDYIRDDYIRDDYKRDEDRKESRNDITSANDIFKEPEIKVQKLQKNDMVWDKEAGNLPPAPRGIPHPNNGNQVNIFEPVPIIKVNETKSQSLSFSQSSQFVFGTEERNHSGLTRQAPDFPSAVFSQGPSSSDVINLGQNADLGDIRGGSINIKNNPSLHVDNLGLPPGFSSIGYPANPNPVISNIPNPVYSNPSPNYSNQNPSYLNQNPSYSNQNPSYSNQNPSFSNPSSGYSNLSNLEYLNTPIPAFSNAANTPNPEYSTIPPNPSYYQNHSSPLNSKPDQSFSQNTGPRVHINLNDRSGFSMEDMKKYGGSGFTSFQSAPAEPVKVDLESKLMSLDNLDAGQPKAKEYSKSRW